MYKTTIEIGNGAVRVRGLTVGEYLELVDRHAFEMGRTDNLIRVFSAQMGVMDMAFVPVIDPDGKVQRDDSGRLVYAQKVEDLGLEKVKEIGGKIFYELTLLTPEEEEKLRGLIRFRFWFSEDKRVKQLEDYDCKTCLRGRIDKTRICGLSKEKRELLQKAIRDEDEKAKKEEKEKERAHIKGSIERHNELYEQAMARSASGRRQVLSLNKPNERTIKKAKGHLTIGEFIYPECPSSWIPDVLKEWAGVLYSTRKDGLMWVEGGTLDQPNKLWRAAQVLVGEAAKVEKEIMEAGKNG